MDFFKDFPDRSDVGTATTPGGNVVAGEDKINDNDYLMIGANGTGSGSQDKGYRTKLSWMYNWIKGKILGDAGMEATSERRGLMSSCEKKQMFGEIADLRAGRRVCASYIVDAPSPIKKYVVMSKYSSADRLRGNYTANVRFASCMNTDTNGCAGSVDCWSADGIAHRSIGEVNRISGVSICRFKYQGATYSGIELSFQGYSLCGVYVDAIVYSPAAMALANESEVSDVTILGRLSTVNTSPSASYIAERYSIDEEQALTRRMIAGDPTVVDQFNAYNDYCEECKARAKEEMANTPQVLPSEESSKRD